MLIAILAGLLRPLAAFFEWFPFPRFLLSLRGNARLCRELTSELVARPIPRKLPES
jgi:hypothetical protein